MFSKQVQYKSDSFYYYVIYVDLSKAKWEILGLGHNCDVEKSEQLYSLRLWLWV